jgi:4'-phosphopantetheinyl transferase
MSFGEQHSARIDVVLPCPTLREWTAGGERPELELDEIGVWLVELDAGLLGQAEIDGAEPGVELAVLDADERARAARFVRARDRRRFARCRAALREILGALVGERPESLRIRVVARGKPELEPVDGVGGPPAVKFNLSHSSDLAVIAVSRGHELGIDLEQIRPIGEAERIVESFFSEAEQTEFARIDEQDRPLAFLRGWTRKEAILKGLGIGIAGLAARHETGFGTGLISAEFRPAVPSSRVAQWQLWEASPRAGFVATVACQVPAAAGVSAPDEVAGDAT